MPLPPGVERDYPPGPEEVIIRRLADPVQVKPAGQHAAYYLRYCKTFSRMGGEMHYLSCDNRDLLLTLAREL